MTTIPNFQAQGRVPRSHDLGAGMSSAFGRQPPAELSAARSRERAVSDRNAGTARRHEIPPLRESSELAGVARA